jgi:hypothetical protein
MRKKGYSRLSSGVLDGLLEDNGIGVTRLINEKQIVRRPREGGDPVTFANDAGSPPSRGRRVIDKYFRT